LVLMALALAAPAAFLPAHAQSLRDIAVNDPERRPLLNALRPHIERDLDQPVRFLVQTIRMSGRWAWIVANPQTPTGQPVDLSGTRYAEAQREGFMDGDTIYALMERVSGRWVMRDFVIGPTDVAYESWPQRYGAPRALFGM
jgi:hypothetical protein